jgi:hypothetical protein
VEAIRSLKVVDPATGSGHFLVAAAQRIGKRLAAVRTGEAEPAPEEVRRGVREAINHCIYGVDINPMAVELCKVSLWMEAMEPGKPLSFLDHHIKVGNSLFGTTPELLAEGIPDDAFAVLTLDEKGPTAAIKKRNKAERGGQASLFNVADAVQQDLSVTAARSARLNAATEDDLAEVDALSASYEKLISSDAYRREKLIADSWCAAFVWPKRTGAPEAVTQDYLRRLASGENALSADQRRTVEELAADYRFFHWHLEFPDVFLRDDEKRQGFDCVLGTPPWERVKLQEKEWFADRAADVAQADTKDERTKLIKELATEDPQLYAEYLNDKRHAEGVSAFVPHGGRYPLCGAGDVNLYALFAELGILSRCLRGRVGLIVPSGIGTDDTYKRFFHHVMDRSLVRSFYEFENRGFFPGTGQGHMNRFCLFTLGQSRGGIAQPRFLFKGRDVDEIVDPERVFHISANDLLLLNPNTGTAPVFTRRRDAEITKKAYAQAGVFIREKEQSGNPWGATLTTMFHMSNDSHLFVTQNEMEDGECIAKGNEFHCPTGVYLPLYEAKMTYTFNHRHGDFAMGRRAGRPHQLPHPTEAVLREPQYQVAPYYWVHESHVLAKLSGRWSKRWFLGWRDVGDSRASARSVIASIIPFSAVANTFPLITSNRVERELGIGLYSNLGTSVFDYLARQKIGGIKVSFFYMKQFPVFPPFKYHEPATWDFRGASLLDWLQPRVLELTYTAHDLEQYARDMGFTGAPFVWDSRRRGVIQAELDAAFFHLYGMEREDVDYVMEQFPVVKERDIRLHGSYLTKERVTRYWEQMRDAIGGGAAFESQLDPPPGDPRATIEADIPNSERRN